jgi:hypothetical protein
VLLDIGAKSCRVKFCCTVRKQHFAHTVGSIFAMQPTIEGYAPAREFLPEQLNHSLLGRLDTLARRRETASVAKVTKTRDDFVHCYINRAAQVRHEQPAYYLRQIP